MNGADWMEKMLSCEQARMNIPMELQATVPLWRDDHTAVSWYYRLRDGADGPQLSSPERRVVWNIDTFDILEMRAMQPEPIGSGGDLLTRAHREREDAYLSDTFPPAAQDVRGRWLEALPQSLRRWMEQHAE